MHHKFVFSLGDVRCCGHPPPPWGFFFGFGRRSDHPLDPSPPRLCFGAVCAMMIMFFWGAVFPFWLCVGVLMTDDCPSAGFTSLSLDTAMDIIYLGHFPIIRFRFFVVLVSPCSPFL